MEAELSARQCAGHGPKLLCWGPWLYFILQLQKQDGGSPRHRLPECRVCFKPRSLPYLYVS